MTTNITPNITENTTDFNIQNEEELIKKYYSNFTDSIYNLFYLGENDYDDANFIGSFTNFENLLEFIKKLSLNIIVKKRMIYHL